MVNTSCEKFLMVKLEKRAWQCHCIQKKGYLDPLVARSEQNEAMEETLTGRQFIEQLGAGKTRPAHGSCSYHLRGTMSSPDPPVRWRKNLAGSFCMVCLSYSREMGTVTATAGAGDDIHHGVYDARRERVGLGVRRAFSRRQ